jgi:hypothetical protein
MPGQGSPALPRPFFGLAAGLRGATLRALAASKGEFPDSPTDGPAMLVARRARLLLLALTLAAAPAGAWDINCKFAADREASIDSAGVQRVEVFARAGDLTVRRAVGAGVVASGKACASHEKYLEQTQVRMRREGEVLQVVVQVPEEMKGIGLFYASLDLTVEVPAGLPVQVTDSSGDVTIDGVRVVHLTDSSGDIEARGLPADIEIDDSSGDIRVVDAAGRVKVVDSSGDIVVHGAREVLVQSDSSGDIDLEEIAGGVRIESDSSGDLAIARVGGNVEVLSDSSGDVRVSAVKGSVKLPDR